MNTFRPPFGGSHSTTFKFCGLMAFVPSSKATETRSGPAGPSARPRWPLSAAAERPWASTRHPAGTWHSKETAFSRRAFTSCP